MSLTTGAVIAGRFEVERLAGAGGMGSVYRARDRETGRAVALKVIHAADAHAAQRFVREARALAELRHRRIVRYVAHGRADDGAPFLAMEWLDGEDLAARLSRGRLSIAQSAALARHVAGALAAAHARGVVHRDVKPSNLFLVDRDVERVTVLDFGVARVAGATAGLTRTGAMLGTPGYMAPEQARGARELDARADVFALGCVLFECLTGRPAFWGDHVMAVLSKILLDDAPRVRGMRPEAPAALDDLVAGMLAKDPAARPADGAAVARALDALELPRDAPTGEPASATRPAPRPASQPASGGDADAPTLAREPTPAPARWVRADAAPGWAIDRDDGRCVLRVTRTSEPMEPGDIVAAVARMRAATADVVLREWAIVVDSRAAPLRTDEAYERAYAALHEFALHFSGMATIVRSAVGRLQNARISRATRGALGVFDDESDAVAFAIARRDEALRAAP